MTRAEGIAESIADCLATQGLTLDATILETLAEEIDHGVSCWNEMSYGHVSNPFETEVREEQGRTKRAIAEHDAAENRWRKDREELAREIRSLKWRLEDAYNKGFRV